MIQTGLSGLSWPNDDSSVSSSSSLKTICCRSSGETQNIKKRVTQNILCIGLFRFQSLTWSETVAQCLPLPPHSKRPRRLDSNANPQLTSTSTKTHAENFASGHCFHDGVPCNSPQLNNISWSKVAKLNIGGRGTSASTTE